jgi:hypothetical protein
MLQLHEPQIAVPRYQVISDINAWAPPLAREIGVSSLSNAQYLESRLAGDSQVDYLCAIRRSAARLMLKRLQSFPRTASDPWTPVEAFVAAWDDGKSLTSLRVPTMWLEFDDVVNAANVGAPSVCACLVPNYSWARPIEPGNWQEDLSLVREILGLLNVPITAALEGDLTRAFELLPELGRWIHLSAMLGRPSRAIKLYGTMPREQLLPTLGRLGWAGNIHALERAIDTLYPRALLGADIFVDLNLENFRDPGRASLGLAIGQQHVATGSTPDPTRRALLEVWQDAGLCSRASLVPLRQWMSLQDAGAWRFLDLKLVWCAGQLTAKAYLGQAQVTV